MFKIPYHVGNKMHAIIGKGLLKLSDMGPKSLTDRIAYNDLMCIKHYLGILFYIGYKCGCRTEVTLSP